MSRTAIHHILESARQLAGLTVAELWWAYLMLGGTASPDDVEGYLAGTGQPDDDQYDRLAQALNERFVDLGRNHPVPYAEALL